MFGGYGAALTESAGQADVAFPRKRGGRTEHPVWSAAPQQREQRARPMNAGV
jgi:hypothetical protein